MNTASQILEIRRAEDRTAALSGLLHAGFVITGVVTTMLGPLLPVLSSRWGLTDARAGDLFTAQFSGSTLGVLGSSWLMARRAHRGSLLFGLGLLAAGSLGLLAGTWQGGMVAALAFGVGLGFAIPTTNLLIAELNPEKRAAALSLVNFSWTVGAAACPFFVSALLRINRTGYLPYGIAVSLLLVAVGLSRVSFPAVAATAKKIVAPAGWWRRPSAFLLGSLFFLYVGTEAALGGWIATFAQRMAAGVGTLWVLMPSIFWIALLLGRGGTPLLLRTIPEMKVAHYGLGLSIAGVSALLAARGLLTVAAGVSLAGLGLASIYPIAISTLSQKFGETASRIAGVMFALAGAGGSILPWLIGYTSTLSGNLKFGLLVPLLSCSLMLIMNWLLARPEQSPKVLTER